MTDLIHKLKITDWAVEDRPREKMLLKGITSLSDAELLAILIGSGNKDETAVELSKRILHSVSNDLNLLGKQTIKDLTGKFKGIGEAKAITIAAAMELGKRRKSAEADINPQIRTSRDIFDIFQPMLGDLQHEESWILLFNRANKIIKKVLISKGNIRGVVIDNRLIIKEAIENNATSIILIHNHPSGNAYPSGNDNQITNKLKGACALFEISLLDHIIVCDTDYYSYKDKGTI
ncbi:DNA repair protein RadC [Dysgonomonas sp. 520]|uniref:RadC family protein n=1 Tax=Dysgonomonas sp. 520 TaxID=2302931 RepID=UPI0013D1EB60|nr:DNA repair protein RadC [Dysgonomonas sp. 520]NDW09091.1 DNA repair protein RadC [Dysgonomonas sp. 520]